VSAVAVSVWVLDVLLFVPLDFACGLFCASRCFLSVFHSVAGFGGCSIDRVYSFGIKGYKYPLG